MGNISVSGLDDLIGDLDELARLPDSVTDQMLNAEADVIEAAQRAEAARMWQGPYYGHHRRLHQKGKGQKDRARKVDHRLTPGQEQTRHP